MNAVQKNKTDLMQNYQKQYQQYMKRFPNNPVNVRFTQEEIDNYFPNTVNIVKGYLDRSEIIPWIFDSFELYEEMYEELTRCFWMEIFGCGEEIFEPL